MHRHPGTARNLCALYDGSMAKILSTETAPVKELKHYGRNPRRGNVDRIVESLRYHGQYRPILVRKATGEVLAGNHTLMAAKTLGWEHIDVTYLEVDSDDDAARIVLMDNRANDLAAYDDNALAELLQSLPELQGTGFNENEMNDLLAHIGHEDLDALSNQFGEANEEDLWPIIRLKVSPSVHERWEKAMAATPGANESEKLSKLLPE